MPAPAGTFSPGRGAQHAPRADRSPDPAPGCPTTTPERTLIDLAGSLLAPTNSRSPSSARRGREGHHGSRSGGRSSGSAPRPPRQRVAAGCSSHARDEPPAESALEVLTARLLRETDLPKPRRQVAVTVSGARYRLDFAWPDERVALECDGRKWHEIESDFERDRQRWRRDPAAATGLPDRLGDLAAVTKSRAAIVAELRSCCSLRLQVSRRDRGEPSGTCAARANDRSASG